MRNYLFRPNGIMEDMFSEFFTPSKSVSSALKTDIKQDEKSYSFEIELSGFKKEEISLTFDDGMMTVTAERKLDAGEGYVLRERKERYERSFYVGEIDEDGIKAKLIDGVLTVNLPKKTALPQKKNIVID